jgi:hypothetical protein
MATLRAPLLRESLFFPLLSLVLTSTAYLSFLDHYSRRIVVSCDSVLVTAEVSPGLAAVPDPHGDSGSDADWTAWIRSGFYSVDHPVGTVGMGRRKTGARERDGAQRRGEGQSLSRGHCHGDGRISTDLAYCTWCRSTGGSLARYY